MQLSNGQRLVLIRNPHGNAHGSTEGNEYYGAWGDESELWTDAFAQEAGLEKDIHDGSFFMAIAYLT